MKKYISVERAHIAYNKLIDMHPDPESRKMKHKPVICVEYEDGRAEEHYNEVAILGPSVVVYRPDNKEPGDPMSVAWIETEAELETR